MRFVDEVPITVESGHGGPGSVHFRREKFIPRGGPDGGNGGRGGHVLFEAHEGLNTLLHFKGRRHYKAEDGEGGSRSLRDGKAGQDLVLTVPVGTQIFRQDGQHGPGAEKIGDLQSDGERLTVAYGGKGGLGNHFFKGPTHQAPRFAQSGEAGQCLELKLELKLLANIALLGLPNAGKSTLISTLSNARPKVADYPFTTLQPQLGVVEEAPGKTLVVADIPGLIAGASQGKGLGTQFLKHIERTFAFVHLVDIALCENEYEAYESYVTIRQELENHNPELLNKKEIVCLTKVDALRETEIQRFQHFFETTLDKKVIALSAVSQYNLDLLKRIMFRTKATT